MHANSTAAVPPINAPSSASWNTSTALAWTALRDREIRTDLCGSEVRRLHDQQCPIKNVNRKKTFSDKKLGQNQPVAANTLLEAAETTRCLCRPTASEAWAALTDSRRGNQGAACKGCHGA